MTTTPITTSTSTSDPAQGTRSVFASARRMWALTRAELRLLYRNRTALLMTVAMPIAFAYLFASTDGINEAADLDMGVLLILMLAAFALLFVVYYNLVATYAARREDLVLKRLRTGELTDPEILAGTAVASVVTALAQIIAIGVVAPLVFDMAMPVNIVLLAVGLVLGIIVWVLLAAASSVFTRNAEMAQITTVPALGICMFFSGLLVPLHVMPDALARVAEFLPLTPMVELMRMGLVGVMNDGTTVDFAASFGAAVGPLAILVAWMFVGGMLVRRYFRWEPRR